MKSNRLSKAKSYMIKLRGRETGLVSTMIQVVWG